MALRDERDPAALATLYDYQAKLKQRRGDYAGAVDILTAADKDLSGRLGDESVIVLRTRLQRAMAMAIAGELDPALAVAQAVMARMRATGQSPVEIATALKSLAYLLARLKRNEAMLTVVDELLAAAGGSGGRVCANGPARAIRPAVALTRPCGPPSPGGGRERSDAWPLLLPVQHSPHLVAIGHRLLRAVAVQLANR